MAQRRVAHATDARGAFAWAELLGSAPIMRALPGNFTHPTDRCHGIDSLSPPSLKRESLLVFDDLSAGSAASLSHRERVGVRGYGLSMGSEPPHPNPLPNGERERAQIGAR
jgi:hypothetical protein